MSSGAVVIAGSSESNDYISPFVVFSSRRLVSPTPEIPFPTARVTSVINMSSSSETRKNAAHAKHPGPICRLDRCRMALGSMDPGRTDLGPMGFRRIGIYERS